MREWIEMIAVMVWQVACVIGAGGLCDRCRWFVGVAGCAVLDCDAMTGWDGDVRAK